MAAVWQNYLDQSVQFWPLSDNSWARGSGLPLEADCSLSSKGCHLRAVIPNRAESPVRACPEIAEGNLLFLAPAKILSRGKT